MPELIDTDIDQTEKYIKRFKQYGWDRNDLNYFYATSTYIKSKLGGRESSLFLRPDDFINCYLYLSDKGYIHEHFRDYLQRFLRLYFGDSWTFPIGERHAMREWLANYKKSLRSDTTYRKNHLDDKNISSSELALVPERKYILLLAIEIAKLQPHLLEKVQSESFLIESNDLQYFYRLPWIWHYGLGELQEMKTTLSTELALAGQEADSIIIGTMMKPNPDIRITSEIKGSEMRAVFEKLDGKTFKLLRYFRMADLGKSSVKFYRMP